MTTPLFNRRLEICQACGYFVNAVAHGACRMLRDPEGRVKAALLTERLESGVCPLGHFEEVNRHG